MGEDDGAAQGRYFRATQSMLGGRTAREQKEKMSSEESDKEFHKALTYLLKNQVELLVKEKGAPSEIMVRFAMLLKILY